MCYCGVVTKTKYCSNQCQRDAARDNYVHAWLEGRETGLAEKSQRVSGYVRAYLFNRCKDACEKCGWSERNPITDMVPLQVNHINGNWKDCSPTNLELICPNCHSLTPNFGNLNRGNGRSK